MGLAKPQESLELPANAVTEGQRPGADAAAGRSPEAESEVVANSIGSLLQRVAGSSVQEIDRLVAELRAMRHLLQTEAMRVERQIIEYAHLSQWAMQTTKVIAENLASRKIDPDELKGSGEDDSPPPGAGPQEHSRAATGLRPEVADPSVGRQNDQVQSAGSASRVKRFPTR
jgi:hypothetical protein